METVRTEAQVRKETILAELKTKLGKIKDEKKQVIVEGVYTKLNEINTRATNQFAEKIDQMEKVLANIKSRADKVAAKGTDITAVRVKITEAETLITSTKTAIATQVAKNYAINVTTEATLKTAVKSTRDLLQADLAKLKATVKSVHDALRGAAATLAQIPKVNEGNQVETTQ